MAVAEPIQVPPQEIFIFDTTSVNILGCVTSLEKVLTQLFTSVTVQV